MEKVKNKMKPGGKGMGNGKTELPTRSPVTFTQPLCSKIIKRVLGYMHSLIP